MRLTDVVLNEETLVTLDYVPVVGDYVIARIHDENGLEIEVEGFVTEVL